MPFRVVDFVQDAIYHACNNGARKSLLFQCSEDYQYLYQLLQTYAARCKITVLVYCFMPDHYHLLLRQDGEIAINLFMAKVFALYSRWFNSKYSQSGTLFEGRFKAVCVDTDFLLSFLCGFIHLNPQEADLVSDPCDWPNSNCRQWVEGTGLSMSELEFISDTFGSSEEYRDFLDAFPEIAAKCPDNILNYLLDS